ncbi:hypothetical protein Taro_016447 [Colocasia esculenta]|uniref:Uncharacterized protein n=1 Tax=Colocasia esculenta TaxID=4460 RepID=A0A843UKB7_COLES|nr:hypothetical protein [Colocasia esculenta]
MEESRWNGKSALHSPPAWLKRVIGRHVREEKPCCTRSRHYKNNRRIKGCNKLSCKLVPSL